MCSVTLTVGFRLQFYEEPDGPDGPKGVVGYAYQKEVTVACLPHAGETVATGNLLGDSVNLSPSWPLFMKVRQVEHYPPYTPIVVLVAPAPKSATQAEKVVSDLRHRGWELREETGSSSDFGRAIQRS